MKGGIIDRKTYSSMTLEQRTQKLCLALGASPEELEALASPDIKSQDKFIEAAVFLYRRLRDLGYEKVFALSHITSGILSLILCPQADFEDSELRTARAISDMFKVEEYVAGDQTFVAITAPQVLRIKAFEEVEGRPLVLNAAKAKKVWGQDVQFSYFDLIRGIKLPNQLTVYESAFIGMIFAQPTIQEKKYSISIWGKRRGREDLVTLMAQMSEKIFNINNNSNRGNGSRQPHPYMYMNSQAVYTWFVNVLGLQKDMNERAFPDFTKLMGKSESDPRPLEEAFLYGLLARRGVIYGKKGLYLVFRATNGIDFLKRLKELSEKVGLYPHLMENDRKLYYRATDVQKIRASTVFDNGFLYAHRGGFFNPAHLRRLK